MDQHDHVAAETHLERVRAVWRFHFFFAGLVFAILSFAIQFPVSSINLWIKLAESLSWVTIGFSGLLALRQIGGFAPADSPRYLKDLSPNWRKVMWAAFLVGIALLLIAKITDSFATRGA